MHASLLGSGLAREVELKKEDVELARSDSFVLH